MKEMETGPVQVFCLPHAGGMASAYACFRKHTGHGLVFEPIELAGRGRRFTEPLYDTFAQAVDDVGAVIRRRIRGRYALFGHSMGSWLAYDVCFRLEEMGAPAPAHVFVSANVPPVPSARRAPLHELPDGAFMERVLGLGGTPREIVQHKELMDLIVPILKADYRMMATRVLSETLRPLRCGLTVLSGLGDKVFLGRAEEMLRWRACTDGDCRHHAFEGDHFYLYGHMPEIVALMRRTLAKGQAECAPHAAAPPPLTRERRRPAAG
jgi:surfactin synthase thioesterase subunit